MLYQLEFNYKKQPAPETKNLFSVVSLFDIQRPSETQLSNGLNNIIG